MKNTQNTQNLLKTDEAIEAILAKAKDFLNESDTVTIRPPKRVLPVVSESIEEPAKEHNFVESTTVKMLKLKVKNLTQQLQQESIRHSDTERKRSEAEQITVKQSAQISQLENQVSLLNKKNKASMDNIEDYKHKLQQCQDGLKNISSAKPTKIAINEDISKLNRTLEQLNSTRHQLKQQQLTHKDTVTRFTQEISLLKHDMKHTDVQRLEFIKTFKKQQELIDVLKRQVMHMEAAGSVKALEQEFTRILKSNQS